MDCAASTQHEAMTLSQLFPGKMGRVDLARVAIRLRMPDLLKMTPAEVMAPELATKLTEALAAVKKG